MTSPIESYLGQLRAKLEARFDSECADQLLSEIRGHLVDSADELEADGVTRVEAERLCIQRFGAPEKAAFLTPLGQQFGTGDRYWGFAAFGLAVFAALGLALYGFSPMVQAFLSREELKPLLTLILVSYTYACWRARSFSMLRQSAAAVAVIVVATGLWQPSAPSSPSSRSAGLVSTRGLLATGNEYGAIREALPGVPGPILADLGVSADRPALGGSPPPNSFAPGPREEDPKLPGMAPMGQNPWDLAQEGLLPGVSQLLLSWLFLLLMSNAAICWIGCLEHEQKGGVALLQ